MPSTPSNNAYLWYEIGPFVAVLVSLWVKTVFFSLSLRGAWVFPDETMENWVRLYPQMFSAALGSLLFLFAFLPLLSRARRFAVLLILNFCITSLILIDLIFFRHYSDVLSFESLASAAMIPRIWSSILHRFHPVYLVLFLDIVLGILVYPAYLRKSKGIQNGWQFPAWRITVSLLAAALFLYLPTLRIVWSDNNGLFAYTTLRRDVCAALGLLPYHFTDVLFQITHNQDAGRKNLDAVRDFLFTGKQEQKSPLFGIARGRNLIVIIAESLHGFPIELHIGDQSVAPNIRSFAKESIHFVNFYDQTYLGTTADAEFISFQSLHPLPAGVVAMKFPSNRFDALPAILFRQGYTTSSAVAEAPTFWQMNAMHPRLGFQRSFFEESFDIPERIGEWLPDQEFFLQSIQILKTQPDPFFAYLLTSTNHDPWLLPPKYRKLKLGKLEGTTLGNYLQSVHYFDSAFGEFLRQLKETQLLDESVVALLGDHQAFLQRTTEFSELLGIPKQNDFENIRIRKQIPFIVRLPGGQAAQASTVTGGHLDVAPTLLSLLGIVERNRIMLGNDLTRGEDSFVIFRDGGFVDGKHLFQNRFGKPVCYMLDSGASVDCRTLESGRRRAIQQLEISDYILHADLIPTLKADHSPVLTNNR